MRRRYLAFVAIGMLVVPGAALASAPTKQQYISKGDALCKRGNAKASGYESQAQKLIAHQPSTTAELKPWATKLSKVIEEDVRMRRTGLQSLRALTAPAGDHLTVTHIWNAFASEVTDLQTFATQLEDFKFSSLKASDQRADNAKTKYDGLAQRFGFKVCGQPTN